MTRIVAFAALVLVLVGCTPKSGIGMRLPDGNAARGRVAYAALHCNSCHAIDGLVPHEGDGGPSIELGGITTRVHSYGELVTSIINPSHKIAPRYPPEQVSRGGQSLMALAYLNDVMTVQQLIDLVAFLETTYEIMPPEVQPYWYAYP
jgi:mono/diheme cytochrome c family protein